jgi:hypothetical protein
MSGLLEVLVGVLAWRRVATSDMTADETFPQLNPSLSGLKALHTAIAAGFHIGIGLLHVFARRHSVLH